MLKIRTLAAVAACALLCTAVAYSYPSDSPLSEYAKTNEYKAMISRSLISTGNNYRIKAAIAKARAGKTVNVAYIGGSITEGYNAMEMSKCYASLSGESFKSLFGKVRALNAGMAGTPSTLGMIRYERDVLKRLKGKPDIVFVEFAVNDGDDPTSGAAFESLVLNILKADNAPAVVLVFSVFKSQWNLQDRLIPIGRRYQLPMISIKDAVIPEIEAGALSEASFFADIYHPTNFGHRIMSDCITAYFKAVDAESPTASDLVFPSTAEVGAQFVGIKMFDRKTVPAGVTVSEGGFSARDSALGSFKYDPARLTFPENWSKTAGSPADGFSVSLVCKNLCLVFKQSGKPGFGTVEVLVDGQWVTSISGYKTGGWNNPYTEVILDEAQAARHTITVRMAEGSEAEAFTILAFGYTK